MTNPIFSDSLEDQLENPIDAYVGPDRKYKTAADFVKGFENGQVHIATIEAENREYRESLQRDIDAQRARLNTPPSQEGNQPVRQEDQRANEQDLVERIREVNRQDRAAEKQAANLATATDRLVEVFGDADAAKARVKARAAELGVSVKFLMDSASQSPAAFFATMELDRAPRSAPAPRSDVNSAALNTQTSGTAKPGTYAYFEEIRKTNKRLYDSPKVQLEMHKAALENPETFFGGR